MRHVTAKCTVWRKPNESLFHVRAGPNTVHTQRQAKPTRKFNQREVITISKAGHRGLHFPLCAQYVYI